jgi:hypothetical protein
LHDDLVIALRGALDWPEIDRWTFRPRSIVDGIVAIALAVTSITCFGGWLAVGVAVICRDPHQFHPAQHYVIASLFMVISITCSRAFMIAAVKRWHRIR